MRKMASVLTSSRPPNQSPKSRQRRIVPLALTNGTSRRQFRPTDILMMLVILIDVKTIKR